LNKDNYLPVSNQAFFTQNCTVHSHGIQLRELKGLIGVREIKRLTDERLIEVRRIAEGDGIGLIEGIEEEGSLRLSFDRDKKEERAHGNKILSTDKRYEK